MFFQIQELLSPEPAKETEASANSVRSGITIAILKIYIFYVLLSNQIV